MKSQYLSTVMSVDDFSQWDFFHIKTRSSDGRKPENLQLVTKSTGKKERKDFGYFFFVFWQMAVDKIIVSLCFV